MKNAGLFSTCFEELVIRIFPVNFTYTAFSMRQNINILRRNNLFISTELHFTMIVLCKSAIIPLKVSRIGIFKLYCFFNGSLTLLLSFYMHIHVFFFGALKIIKTF